MDGFGGMPSITLLSNHSDVSLGIGDAMMRDDTFGFVIRDFEVCTTMVKRARTGICTGLDDGLEQIVIVRSRSDGREVHLPREVWDGFIRLVNALRDDYE